MNLQESMRNDIDLIKEQTATTEMASDAQEILKYLGDLAITGDIIADGDVSMDDILDMLDHSAGLVRKMEAITSFVNDSGMA
jgi:hypothetical protein